MLINKELRSIETHSRTKYESSVYSGEYSSLAIWQRNLHSRVVHLRVLYGQISWLHESHTAVVK